MTLLALILGATLATLSTQAVTTWFMRKPDFETSVKPELPVLYRVARRFARNEDEAADLVQQTLIKAHAAWGRFDGRHCRSWLIRILRNEHLMQRRSDARADLVELDDQQPAEGTPFWDEVLWRQQAHRILEELAELPDEFKLAVTLVDLEQMSYQEAALAMDAPIGTVRSRVSRGRALLRNRLTDLLEETP